MGHMGHGDTGGYGVQGIGTWAMRLIGEKGYRGMGTGVWGTWSIKPTGGVGHRGCGVQRVWGTLAIDHNGYRGMGYRGMGHMGNGTHG